jgi:TPR repeat protein
MGTAGNGADELASGVRAFQKGLYAEAHGKLLKFAEEGDLRAQMIMSRLYYAGNGVEKNHEKYVYWLQKAADSGDKASKSQLKRLKKRGQI